MNSSAGQANRPWPDRPISIRPPYEAVLLGLNTVVIDTAAVPALVYPGTESFLRRLSDSAVPVALVTSSPDAGSVLAATGIGHLVTPVVDATSPRAPAPPALKSTSLTSIYECP